MLTAEINGNIYSDAVAIGCSRSLKQLYGRFNIIATANKDDALPVKYGDIVKILADGNVILVGYIENISVNYGERNHIIRISGFDRTVDMSDSSVTGQKTFNGNIGFEDIARTVLDNGNMDFIDIVNEAGEITDFTSNDIINAEVGQSIFDFLEKYARKKQFILTTNENGDLLMCRASNDRLGANLVHLKGNNTNNVLNASFNIGGGNRYNKYICRSQLNPYSQSGNIKAQNIANQSGETGIDEFVRTSRILEFVTEHDEDNASVSDRAQFEANTRRANSVDYTANVQGHSIDGNPFKVNRLAFINDDYANISSDMLLHTINYIYSVDEGSITELSFSYPDAFSLNAKQSEKAKARSKIGDGFE